MEISVIDVEASRIGDQILQISRICSGNGSGRTYHHIAAEVIDPNGIGAEMSENQ